jgi:hypothetical protein
MSLPTVYAIGAVAEGTTAAITPAIPAGTVGNDILICVCETGQQPITTPSGWAIVGGAAVVQATGLVTDLTVYWKRAVGGDTSPSLLVTTGPQDHIVARIIGVRGCITSGSPINGTPVSSLANTAATAVSITGGTTTAVNCLVFAIVSTGLDPAASSTVQISGWTNASLGSLTEQADNWTANGNGGGFGVATGTLAVAGAYSATTATLVTANTQAKLAFALQGGDPAKQRYVGNPYDSRARFRASNW